MPFVAVCESRTGQREKYREPSRRSPGRVEAGGNRVDPHPVFCVSVASKGLSVTVSLFFATLRGGPYVLRLKDLEKRKQGGKSQRVRHPRHGQRLRACHPPKGLPPAQTTCIC